MGVAGDAWRLVKLVSSNSAKKLNNFLYSPTLFV